MKEDLISRLQSFEDSLNKVVINSIDIEDSDNDETADTPAPAAPAAAEPTPTVEEVDSTVPAPTTKVSLISRLVQESAREALKSITVNSIIYPSTDPNFFKRKLNDVNAISSSLNVENDSIDASSSNSKRGNIQGLVPVSGTDEPLVWPEF